MRVIRGAKDLQSLCTGYRKAGLSVGLVPTLGELHEGHLTLIRRARDECERVVTTIYRNPTQFDSRDDLASYSENLGEDLDLCRNAEVDLAYLGQESDLFPRGFQSWVEVRELTGPLCGPLRPGHFRGVVTVVSQLFHLTRPHRAYFGFKDFQQARVIQRLVRDLLFDVEIRLSPTVRDDDGLALSSRNARLAPEERAAAPAIYRALQATREKFLSGETRREALQSLLDQKLLEEPMLQVEYAEILDGETLKPFDGDEVHRRGGGVLIAVGASLGRTRLIDNVWLRPVGAQPGEESSGGD